MDSDSYKYPMRGLAERQANRPTFPFCLCVRFRATAAPLISFHLHLCFFVTLACPTRSRLSPLATAVREPVRSSQLTISSPSCLDRRPVTHACGSGNNKPRTPLPVTLARVPSSGTSRGFIYIAHFRTLARTHTPLYNPLCHSVVVLEVYWCHPRHHMFACFSVICHQTRCEIHQSMKKYLLFVARNGAILSLIWFGLCRWCDNLCHFSISLTNSMH